MLCMRAPHDIYSFSLSDEAHMAVAFEAGSGIVLLNNDTSVSIHIS